MPARLLLVSRSDEELVLLRVKLGLQTLSETLPGYPIGKDGAVLLPFGQICRLLEIPIRVDTLRGFAEGQVGNDPKPFRLDLGRGRVIRNGQEEVLAPETAELHEDDIYVSSKVLALWLPADFKVDLRGATVVVAGREPLPIQQRWERERSWARLSGAEAARALPAGVKPLDDPYRVFEAPMLDLYLQGNSRPGTEGSRQTSAQGALDASGDILGLSGRGYLATDTSTHTSTGRLTLGRHDPHGGLLGPLHAKVAEFGDVEMQGVDLVTPFLAGTGVRVDNWPLGAQGFTDRRTFRGTLPPGWTVELYLNGALLAYQASRADGLYEFLEVQLAFGWNDVRLAFYGPGGEKREEKYRFDLTQPPVAKGEFRYRLGALRPRGTSSDEYLGELAYGFGKSLAAGGGFARIADATGVERDYGTGFVQSVWSGLSAKLSLSGEQGGGSAEQVGLFSRLGSLGLSLQHSELQGGFASPLFGAGTDLVRRRSELGLFGSLPSMERPFLSLGLNLRRDELVSGGTDLHLQPRLSTTVGRWFFTNLLDWEQRSQPGLDTTRQGSGDLLVSRSFGRTTFRGDLAYTVEPTRRLQSWGLQADDARFAPWIFQAGYRENLAALAGQQAERSIQASASKLSGRFALGLGAGWSSLQGWTATVTFRVGLAREPFTGRWHSQATPITPYGALSARGTVALEQGPQPTQGAPSVRVDHQYRPPVAGLDGVSFLPQLPPDQDLLVQAGPSAEDPLLQPVAPGWTVVPRPGHVTRIEVAMAGTGEITGTVYLKVEGRKVPMAGAGLQVVDPAGQVVREFTSEYDGFFDLANLPPGTYRLRIAPESLAARGIADPGPRPFVIPQMGAQLDGLDLVAGSAASKSAPALVVAPAAPAPAPALPALPAAPQARELPPGLKIRSRTRIRRAAIEAADWDAAYAMSKEDLSGFRGGDWTVRAQVGALDVTVIEALALFLDPELDCFALPMALPNGQCCPQLLLGHFRTRAAAEAFRRRLPAKLWDAPPRIERVSGILAHPSDCSFHAH
ncbi:MAG TPA: carboxypeptidase-like regulatory domain-containing protein [Holophagaceae bacterium]|nr:carboxypeptidase-like regulatory domain-containing protein [Holophagaceae bacterium]